MGTKIGVDLQPGGRRIVLTTPRSQEFIGDLKRGLPASARRWDPDRRAWIVDRDLWRDVRVIVEHHFSYPEYEYSSAAQSARLHVPEAVPGVEAVTLAGDGQAPEAALYSILGLCVGAPTRVIHAAYAALEAAEVAPVDPGGAVQICEVRGAYQAICAARQITPVNMLWFPAQCAGAAAPLFSCTSCGAPCAECSGDAQPGDVGLE